MRGRPKDDIHAIKYSELAILQGSFSETCPGFFKSAANSIGRILRLASAPSQTFFHQRAETYYLESIQKHFLSEAYSLIYIPILIQLCSF